MPQSRWPGWGEEHHAQLDRMMDIVKEETVKGSCFVCQGGTGVVSEMTDGAFSTTICDGCREMVTVFFHVHRDLMTAVLEAARAKRGKR